MKKYIVPILFVALMTACGGEKEAPKKERLRPVRSMVISESASSDAYVFTGTTKSTLESKLSFKVSGQLKQVNVKVGDRVTKGTVLASIDPTDYLVELRQSEANKKATEAQYVSARSSYYRIEKLFEANSLPLSDFEEAKAGFESAKAKLLAAKEQVAAVRNKVTYTRLEAPIDGVVTDVSVEENEMVSSSSKAFTMSATSKVEIKVGVPENLIAHLSEGMSAKATFASLNGKVFPGTVTEVGYSSLGGSTYLVTVVLDGNDKAIRPGMPADVEFRVEGGAFKGNIVVPASAVGEDSKGRFVYTLEKQSGKVAKVKKAYVKIGALTPRGFVIKEGLGVGQVVATAGLSVLLEGVSVRLD
ncbi:hemolysin secretion protein D [Fulvitalea axinellae]|uniref:Hemolysin secretion protein D n=1 Tax=Fulvitalea axinellae TaxID=1182444 RepID=A0AAU9D0P3_9BACT|nr:hemolysin secretion protein D [Fulvitalea axinellae]